MSTLTVDVSQNGCIKNVDSSSSVHELDEYDFSRLPHRPRNLNLERQRSFDERSLTDLPLGLSPHPPSRADNFFRAFDHLDSAFSPGRRSGYNTPTSQFGYGQNYEPHPMIAEAWDNIRRSLVYFRESACWDNCRVLCQLVSKYYDPIRNTETLIADFGESAIGRVAPVDSGFWWIILLRAYTKSTGDSSLAEMPECQKGMRLILSLCLSEGFDTFPTLLCADGCCMIDRRMGVYGYPIEIQALFFMALRCAMLLLKQDAPGKELIERIVKRLHALSYHLRSYFWLDLKQLNDIYRYKTEEYSHTAVNKFNVIPDSLPEWVFDFMPLHGGYFIGNVGPSNMDFRWFCLGNCIAILSSLATHEQSMAIMDLIESRWEELVGDMPLKVCYPAIENHEWRIVTGCDPKNTRWSYHNGGSWPVIFYGSSRRMHKTDGPRRSQDVRSNFLKPGCRKMVGEYYDGKLGGISGSKLGKNQTWSVAGYLVAKMFA
ncbi:hypothetical protein DH2020_044822 [Rehmannia glutinosa]|uniref:Alkaline/neutral invertase n=1 Tax=Rehmannia glutinosa TaxID=99300 RepID=A0ABR0UFV8_REHGL